MNGTTNNNIREKADEAKDTLTQKAGEAKEVFDQKASEAKEVFDQKASEAKEVFDQQVQNLDPQVREALDIKSHVQERPWLTFGAALAVGYVLGSMTSNGNDQYPRRVSSREFWNSTPPTTADFTAEVMRGQQRGFEQRQREHEQQQHDQHQGHDAASQHQMHQYNQQQEDRQYRERVNQFQNQRDDTIQRNYDRASVQLEEEIDMLKKAAFNSARSFLRDIASEFMPSRQR